MSHVLVVVGGILLVAFAVVTTAVSVKLSKHVRYETSKGLACSEWGLTLKQRFLFSGLWSASMAGYIAIGHKLAHNLEGRALLWWMVGLAIVLLMGGVLITHDPKGKRMIASSRVPQSNR